MVIASRRSKEDRSGYLGPCVSLGFNFGFRLWGLRPGSENPAAGMETSFPALAPAV